jgi:chemotaxis protein MotB
MARTTFQWAALGALALLLTGCVSQEKYNALKLERDQLAERLGQAQAEAASARSQADAYQKQLQAFLDAGGNKDALVQNLNSQIADLQKQLDDVNRRYADAMGRQGSTNALPEPLTNELRAFAAANPDLVDFDAARGIVKFKSDVTFATGSAELQPKAKDAIDKFATILNSAAASGYELIVAGHTDNQRVVNDATIKAGHKDNWYLSAHRAIAVGGELMHQNVNPQRIGVTGFADQRPVASNASESGRAQNRRVEVLILPSTVRGGAAVAGGGSKSAPAPKAKMNKDTGAAVDNRPVMNK